MSQGEALEVLIKNGGWMSTTEIAKKMKITKSTVSSNLNALYKFGDVARKHIKSNHSYLIWRAKDE